MMHIGEIILTQDIEHEIEYQSMGIAPSDIYIPKETKSSKDASLEIISELKISMVSDIIAQAYIASQSQKTIIIAANSFRNEAQNALLKILDEPPQNIKFIIITKNKNALLPTIRSRMMLTDKRHKATIPDFALDLGRLDLGQIYYYIKSLSNIKDSKLEGKIIIESLLFSVAKHKLKLTKEELEMFDKAFLELENYRRIQLVLLPLLLMIHKKCKAL